MSESILANISNNVRLFTNIIINPYIRDSKSTTNIYGYRELDRLYEITLRKTKLLINILENLARDAEIGLIIIILDKFCCLKKGIISSLNIFATVFDLFCK